MSADIRKTDPNLPKPKPRNFLSRRVVFLGALAVLACCGLLVFITNQGASFSNATATVQAATQLAQRLWTPTASATPTITATPGPTATPTITPTPTETKTPTPTIPPKTETAIAHAADVAGTATAKAIGVAAAASTQTQVAAVKAQTQVVVNATATIEAYRTSPPKGQWGAQGGNISVSVGDFRYFTYSNFDFAGNGAKYIAFAVRIDNGSSSDFSVNPNYLTLVDLEGTAHSYDAVTFSYWSQPFSDVNVPAGSNALGGIVFVISANSGPAQVIFNDEALLFATKITVDLLRPPDSK